MTSSNVSSEKSYIDKGWAWVILVASSVLMILIQGNLRSFGIFLVEIKREFEASAAGVSSILSTQAIAISISAFIVLNCLSKSLPLRLLVIMGCLFSGICYILDWQATKIELVTVFHVLNGMGSAFTYGPTMVLLGHYFVKYRGTAYALTSCGSSVGQFALSPLFSYLISVYGVKGALLLNAGIYFQCITFAMLLRPTSYFHRPPTKKKTVSEEEGEEEGDKLTDALSDNATMERTCMMDIEEENELPEEHDEETPEEKKVESLFANGDVKQNSMDEITHLQDDEQIQNCTKRKKMNSENSEDLNVEMMDLSFESSLAEKGVKHGRCFCKFILSELRTLFTNVDFKLFKSPIFLTYFFGSSIGLLASFTPQQFFSSHAEDMGLDRKQGMMFVAIAGFADLGGRILTTLLADQKFLNRPRFLGCVLIVHGIAACFIPLLTNFQTFSTYCVIYGASGGVMFAISNTILLDYIGVTRLSQGLGLMLFFNGFATAAAFLLIGFLREFNGSYIPGFVMNGIGLLVSGVLFLSEACIKYEKQPRS